MDTWIEYWKARMLLYAIVAFIISGFVAWNEVRYLAFGKETTATIVDISQYETRGKYGRAREHQRVTYSFKENSGIVREESVSTSPGWDSDTPGLVEVQYIPGVDGKSRLAGSTQWWALVLFFGTLAVVVYKTIDTVRDAYAFEREKKAASAF